MKYYFNSRLAHVAWLRKTISALVCTLALVSNSFALDVHLAPDGNDSNDGASLAHAVATLKRAVELAAGQLKLSKASSILVHPGTYRGQSVVINGNILQGSLEIIGQAKKAVDFPVFVDDGRGQTWLTLKSSIGRSTGLTIQGLEIRDYSTAISLEGNREESSAYNSGTTIRRNIFRNIGSISTTNDVLSTAAVRFINSKNNLVEFNYFRTIRNKTSCGALHALYLAHFSSGNKIASNTFDDLCGSVIKLRDRSNDNVIEDNKIAHVEKAPVIEEWFCDMGARKDCTKKIGECPSTGNVQGGNVLKDSDQSEMVSVIGGRSQRAWCSSDDFARVRVLAR